MNKISATLRALGMLLLAVTVLRIAAGLYGRGEPETGVISLIAGTGAATGLVCVLMLKRIRVRGLTFPFASTCLAVALAMAVSAIGIVVVRCLS